MYKKILATSMVAASLLFVGCGEESTSCRIDVQQAIDKGNYTTAIDKLNGECAAAFSASDRNFNLATAYLGESGFGLTDVVDVFINANDSAGGAFTSFTSSIDRNVKDDSIALLEKASQYFYTVIDSNSSTACSVSNLVGKDTRYKNACLYLGFSKVITTTASISYLTGDIETLVASIDNNGSASTPDDMKASLDALAWATGAAIPNASVITPTPVTIASAQYQHLEVVQNGKTFYRLADTNAPSPLSSTVVTAGYCDTNADKTPCEGIENLDGSIDTTKPAAASCYACPVLIDGGAKGTVELLVDSLNQSKDIIIGVTDDPDITQSINDFITEIDSGGDGSVSVDEILNYLNQ